MRIQFSFVGEARLQQPEDLYVDLPVVPRVGETVEVPSVSQAHTVVRTIVWYPFGEDGDGDPFVYVVLGEPRR